MGKIFDSGFRLIDAFRDAEVLTPSAEKLLLENALSALRGVLSYHHTKVATDAFHQVLAFASQVNRPEYIRKAKFYMRFAWVFRFHRIPFVEKTYRIVRRVFTRVRK